MDRVKAIAIAKKIVQRHQGVVKTIHFTAGKKAERIVQEFLENGVGEDELKAAQGRYAKHCDKHRVEGDARCGAERFFGDGIWESFREEAAAPVEDDPHERARQNEEATRKRLENQ